MMKIGSASYKHELRKKQSPHNFECYLIYPILLLAIKLKINVCIEGSIFHFQSWKRNFYYHSIKSLNIIGAYERSINGVMSERGFFPTPHFDAHLPRNSQVVNCVEFESTLRSCICMENVNHLPQSHEQPQYYHFVLVGIALHSDTGYINHYLDLYVENAKTVSLFRWCYFIFTLLFDR